MDGHEEAFAILRSLIEKIVIRPAGREFEIVLLGDIASMVEVEDSKAAIRNDLFYRSVKVVAGEGVEPPTLGL